MTIDPEKPDVYSLTFKQWLLFAVASIPLSFIIWLLFHKGSVSLPFMLFSVVGLLVGMWVLAPRVVLAPNGLTVTICMLPWIRRTPWHQLKRAGMNRSGSWIWIEKIGGDSTWIWLLLVYAGGKEVLERIGARYERHLNQFCHQCDYDLQGNDSGRCPECGSEVPHREPSLRLEFPPPVDQ